MGGLRAPQAFIETLKCTAARVVGHQSHVRRTGATLTVGATYPGAAPGRPLLETPAAAHALTTCALFVDFAFMTASVSEFCQRHSTATAIVPFKARYCQWLWTKWGSRQLNRAALRHGRHLSTGNQRQDLRG